MQEVVIVRTGTANLASVLAAFKRANVKATLTDNPHDILRAKHVVLPGVGAFAAAMHELRYKHLDVPLKQRMLEGLPTLSICLGLQLLCESSDESPGVQGLGIVKGHVRRFENSVRVPQHGWNTIEADSHCRILQSGYVYFSNSYCLQDKPEGWNVAIATHGIPFVAAFERGAVVACQFHPELSGAFGAQLLQRWLEIAC
jgi:imidazole glycerol-phosphate synthase subunit HisH